MNKIALESVSVWMIGRPNERSLLVMIMKCLEILKNVHENLWQIYALKICSKKKVIIKILISWWQ